MATRDWLAIKTEYVTGEVSMRKLADSRDVSASTLIERAVAEDWEEERNQYRIRVAQKAMEMAELSEAKVRQTILSSFVRAHEEWAKRPGRAMADDYGALARLSASIVGLDTEHGTSNVHLDDWRAGKSAEEIAAVEQAVAIVNGGEK